MLAGLPAYSFEGVAFTDAYPSQHLPVVYTRLRCSRSRGRLRFDIPTYSVEKLSAFPLRLS
jgi:hypothetical protein